MLPTASGYDLPERSPAIRPPSPSRPDRPPSPRAGAAVYNPWVIKTTNGAMEQIALSLNANVRSGVMEAANQLVAVIAQQAPSAIGTHLSKFSTQDILKAVLIHAPPPSLPHPIPARYDYPPYNNVMLVVCNWAAKYGIENVLDDFGDHVVGRIAPIIASTPELAADAHKSNLTPEEYALLLLDGALRRTYDCVRHGTSWQKHKKALINANLRSGRVLQPKGLGGPAAPLAAFPVTSTGPLQANNAGEFEKTGAVSAAAVLFPVEAAPTDAAPPYSAAVQYAKQRPIPPQSLPISSVSVGDAKSKALPADPASTATAAAPAEPAAAPAEQAAAATPAEPTMAQMMALVMKQAAANEALAAEMKALRDGAAKGGSQK